MLNEVLPAHQHERAPRVVQLDFEVLLRNPFTVVQADVTLHLAGRGRPGQLSDFIGCKARFSTGFCERLGPIVASTRPIAHLAIALEG